MKSEGEKEIKTKKVALAILRGSMYDYYYRFKPQTISEGEWTLWIDMIDKTEEISAQAIA